MTNRTFRFIVYIQLIIIVLMLSLVTAGDHILGYVHGPSYESALQLEGDRQALLE